MRTRESLARRAGEACRARPGFVSVAVLTLGACGVGASDLPDPRARFVAEVWPTLSNCRACHEKQPGMDFLAPGEPTLAYDTVFAYQPTIVDIETPASSLLLTMGQHTGPALTPYAADRVRGWLEDERAARLGADAPPIVAGPFEIAPGGATVVDLGPAGAPGAVLRFSAETLATGLYLTGLEIVTGAEAIRVTHPLFVADPADAAPVPDPVDRFAELDAEVPPYDRVDLGGGRALFVGFRAADPLRVHFRVLEVIR